MNSTTSNTWFSETTNTSVFVKQPIDLGMADSGDLFYDKSGFEIRFIGYAGDFYGQDIYYCAKITHKLPNNIVDIYKYYRDGEVVEDTANTDSIYSKSDTQGYIGTQKELCTIEFTKTELSTDSIQLTQGIDTYTAFRHINRKCFIKFIDNLSYQDALKAYQAMHDNDKANKEKYTLNVLTNYFDDNDKNYNYELSGFELSDLSKVKFNVEKLS